METGRVADLSSRRRSRAAGVSARRRFRWVWLAWLALPLLLLWALRAMPWGDVWRVLSSLRAWQVAALAAANLAVLGLFSARWWLAVHALGQRASFWRLFAYRLAGFGVSYYTPGPQFGGEPLQVLLLQRGQALSAGSAMASVFLERLFDLLANFTFLAVGLGVALALGLLHGGIPAGLWLLIPALLVGPGLHLRALALGKRPFTWLLRRAQQRWGGQTWTAALRHGAEGEELIGGLVRERPAALVGLLAISALGWVVMVAEFTLLLRFLGAPVSLAQSVAILSAARVAFLLPIPGGLGTLEASQYLALQAAGFDPAIGLAASLIIRARDMSLGAIGLWIGAWNTRRER